MSGAPGIETAIGGSHTEFVRAKVGMPRHRVRAALAGGAPDITRLLACVLLLIADGDVLSITVREDFGMTEMSVAGTEAIGAAAGATNGVTKEVIVATVTRRVKSAMIVGVTVGASAAMIAVKIPLRTAVIAARPAVKIALAGRCRAMVLVADAKGPTAAVKRAVIVDIMESVAAIAAMRVMTGGGEHCAWLAGERAR